MSLLKPLKREPFEREPFEREPFKREPSRRPPCEMAYLNYIEQYLQRKVEAAQDDDHAASEQLVLDSFRSAMSKRVTIIADGEDDATANSKGEERSSLIRMGNCKERYSDECIYLLFQATLATATEELRARTLLVDSVLTHASIIKTRKNKPDIVVCPVHRPNRGREIGEEHWVFYGVRREPSDIITVYFSNSLEGGHDVDELARLDTLIRRFDETFPSIVTTDVVRLDCPIQTDIISCGVYVAETIRRFVLGESGSWLPPELIRKSHLMLVEGFLGSSRSTKSVEG